MNPPNFKCEPTWTARVTLGMICYKKYLNLGTLGMIQHGHGIYVKGGQLYLMMAIDITENGFHRNHFTQ